MYEVSGELTVILIIVCGCKFRERLAVSKHPAQKYDGGGRGRYLRKLNELEARKRYQI